MSEGQQTHARRGGSLQVAVKPKADTSNAHVRATSKRQSPEVQADEAQRLLDDPAYQRGVERVREGLVHQLESFKSGGSEADDDWEREVCRALRTLKTLRLAIAGTVQGQTLREAGFKPVELKRDS